VLTDPLNCITPKTFYKGIDKACEEVGDISCVLCESRFGLAWEMLGFSCWDCLAREKKDKGSSRLTLPPRANPDPVQFTNHSFLRIVFRDTK